MKERGITRNDLTFNQIVLLYNCIHRKEYLKIAKNNTERNAKEIIRDPVTFTHSDDRFTTRQSRNHMRNCRAHYTNYCVNFDKLHNKFILNYSENERVKLFEQAQQFIHNKQNINQQRSNAQY